MINARADHLREYYNLDIYKHTLETGNAWVVSKNKLAYLQPVRYNEMVLYQSRLLYSDRRRVMPQCVMFSEDRKTLHAVLWSEFFYIDIKNQKPKKHEDHIQSLLDQITIDSDSGKKLDQFDFDESVRQIVKEFNAGKINGGKKSDT